jgi:hypothetical protein
VKRRILGALPFLLGFGLGLWLFRSQWFGVPTRAWFEIPHRFGVGWQIRLDYDFDGEPDLIEYVKPRGHLMFYAFGFGPPRNPDFREIIWKVGPIERIRIWFQPPAHHNIVVASVAFRSGPEVVVGGLGNLCSLLKEQPMLPFSFLPTLEDLGCGKSWPLR